MQFFNSLVIELIGRHRNRIKICCVFCIGIFSGLTSSSASAEIAIIAQKENPFEYLTQKQARRIFVGRIKEYPDGERVQVVHQKDSQRIKTEFIWLLTGLRLSKYHSKWAALLFAGHVVAHNVVNDDEDVIEWVKKSRYAIGYVNLKSVTKDVKVLYIVKSGPISPDD